MNDTSLQARPEPFLLEHSSLFCFYGFVFPFRWYSLVAFSVTRFGVAHTSTCVRPRNVTPTISVHTIARDHHVPSADESDSQSDPTAAVVHVFGHRLPAWRHPTLRCGLRGAILHHVGAVAASDLLHLRVGQGPHCHFLNERCTDTSLCRFLFLVMVVLIITCAEVSILLCYFQLCNEDYRWWWRSFLSSGSQLTHS